MRKKLTRIKNAILGMSFINRLIWNMSQRYVIAVFYPDGRHKWVSPKEAKGIIADESVVIEAAEIRYDTRYWDNVPDGRGMGLGGSWVVVNSGKMTTGELLDGVSPSDFFTEEVF